MDAPHALQAHYDAILARSIDAIRKNQLDLDLKLDARLAAGPDTRRGLSVIARPNDALAARLAGVLDRLEAVAPGQYRHPRADLHVTILALFTVCEDYHAELARLPEYRAAVQAALAGLPAFEIEFRGLTSSRGAVLAQGFPLDATLARARARLRAQLRTRALDASLDGRYTLVTAHATLLRFVRPLADAARFADTLAALRTEPLGTLRVDRVELVRNDWTMSSGTLQRIDTFALA
jgi:2'-5' RNA ligase